MLAAILAGAILSSPLTAVQEFKEHAMTHDPACDEIND